MSAHFCLSHHSWCSKNDKLKKKCWHRKQSHKPIPAQRSEAAGLSKLRQAIGWLAPTRKRLALISGWHLLPLLAAALPLKEVRHQSSNAQYHRHTPCRNRDIFSCRACFVMLRKPLPPFGQLLRHFFRSRCAGDIPFRHRPLQIKDAKSIAAKCFIHRLKFRKHHLI